MPRRQLASASRVRLRSDLNLTQAEIRKLEEQAAADLRSVADFVYRQVIQDMERKKSTPGETRARPGDKRSGYPVGLSVSARERRAIQKRAEEEGRSLSNYLTVVVLRALG